MASKHFSWNELLRSNTAERHPRLRLQQMNPPQFIRDNLVYLAEMVLEPVREIVGGPIRVTSGYRCPGVNSKVGGSQNSQHLVGQAADLQITERPRGMKKLPGANPNFYLFTAICLNLEKFDVDQVIHEYGASPGRPAWIHVSASVGKDKRQVLKVGHYTGKKFIVITVKEALELHNESQ